MSAGQTGFVNLSIGITEGKEYIYIHRISFSCSMKRQTSKVTILTSVLSIGKLRNRLVLKIINAKLVYSRNHEVETELAQILEKIFEVE